MEVLNPVLYKKLDEVFPGEVKVSAEGNTGSFTYPDSVDKLNKKRNRKKYAHVTDWGEVYHVCCPNCGDTRHRLYFSYLNGCTYKKNKSTPRVYFPRRIFHCKNENCRQGLEKYIKQLDFDDVDLNKIEREDIKLPEKKTYNKYLSVDVTVPENMLRLISDNIPGRCVEYLQSRRFSLNELDSKHACKYIPPGSTWVSADKQFDYTFREENIFIPVIQSRKLVSWQARPLRKTRKGERKYYNMPGSKSCLYNMDTALNYSDIMLVEGITDVWRCGDQSLAVLGSNITSDQKFCLQTIWNMDGRCVIFVEYDARKKWFKHARKFVRESTFKNGVCLIGMSEGRDPADHTEKEIEILFKYGLENCTTKVHTLEVIEEEDVM